MIIIAALAARLLSFFRSLTRLLPFASERSLSFFFFIIIIIASLNSFA